MNGVPQTPYLNLTLGTDAEENQNWAKLDSRLLQLARGIFANIPAGGDLVGYYPDPRLSPAIYAKLLPTPVLPTDANKSVIVDPLTGQWILAASAAAAPTWRDTGGPTGWLEPVPGIGYPIHCGPVTARRDAPDGNLFLQSYSAGGNPLAIFDRRRAIDPSDNTPLVANDLIATLEGRGSDSTPSVARGLRIFAQAAETWNGTSHGTDFFIQTTRNSSGNPQSRLIFKGSLFDSLPNTLGLRIGDSTDPREMLDVAGAAILGASTATSPADGTFQYAGGHPQARVASLWVNLDENYLGYTPGSPINKLGPLMPYSVSEFWLTGGLRLSNSNYGATPPAAAAGVIQWNTTAQHFQGFNGTTWLNLDDTGGGGGASVTVGPTAPVAPTSGSLWWRNDPDGNLYIYYPEPALAPTVSDGFEPPYPAGNTLGAPWTGSNNSTLIATAQAHGGTQSIGIGTFGNFSNSLLAIASLTAWTLDVWLWVANNGGTVQYIGLKNSAAGTGIVVNVTAGGAVTVEKPGTPFAGISKTVTLNAWHHYVLAVTHAASGGTITLTVDGTAAGTFTGDTRDSAGNTSSNQVVMQANSIGPSPPAQIYVDDLIVYSSAGAPSSQWVPATSSVAGSVWTDTGSNLAPVKGAAYPVQFGDLIVRTQVQQSGAADGSNYPILSSYSHSATAFQGASLIFARSRPSLAVPQSGDFLGVVSFNGYTPSAVYNIGASIAAIAGETYTNTANGARLAFSVTPLGSATSVERLGIEPSGRVTIPGSSDTTDQSAFVLGSRTAKARVMTLPGVDYTAWDLNVKWNGSVWGFDDPAKPAWRSIMRLDSDNFSIERHAPGNITPAILLTLDNVGNQTLAGYLITGGSIIAKPSTANAWTEAQFYGAGAQPGGVFKGFQSRGSIAAPTPSIANDLFTIVSANGCYQAGSYSEQATFRFVAAENWTAAARGVNVVLYTTPAGTANATGASFIFANDGTLTISGAHAYKTGATTAWEISSDRRLKTEITDYTAGLAAVLALQPRTFLYNGKGGSHAGTRGCGFIADEVEPVMPEMVGTRQAKLNADDAEPTDIQTLDTSNVTLALVNAVKELASRVAALEAR